MFKKIFMVLLLSIILSACKDEVSGKFSGQWVEPTSTVTITNKGDHYEVHHVDLMLGRDSTFDVSEDGDYLRTKSSNRIEYTLVSPTELALGNNNKVLWTKK